jgi:methionine-gamma-lyase
MANKKEKFAHIFSDKASETVANSHLMPLYLSSTYIYPSVAEAQAVFEGKKEGTIYARWSHPNAELVEQKIASLYENEVKVLAFSSGMAAISTVFQGLLKPNDTAIVQGNIYGTTIDYANHMAATMGVKIVFADFKKLDVLEDLCKEHKPKMLFAETPSNPTIACYDIKAISKISHKLKAKLVVDNTFATPYLQKTLDFGADIEVDSSTKFLNGHGTGLSGLILCRDAKFMKDVIWKLRKLNGTIISPLDAWLLNLGLKTLSLRMEKHCENALFIAKGLSVLKALSSVNYLGLNSHPDHKLAKTQMKNFGGVLSFELKGGYKSALKLLKNVKLCHLTASLGTTDTLIQHPASMSHYFVPKKQREEYGISDGLVRLAVGLEDPSSILQDIKAALK